MPEVYQITKTTASDDGGFCRYHFLLRKIEYYNTTNNSTVELRLLLLVYHTVLMIERMPVESNHTFKIWSLKRQPWNMGTHNHLR